MIGKENPTYIEYNWSIITTRKLLRAVYNHSVTKTLINACNCQNITGKEPKTQQIDPNQCENWEWMLYRGLVPRGLPHLVFIKQSGKTTTVYDFHCSPHSRKTCHFFSCCQPIRSGKSLGLKTLFIMGHINQLFSL